MPRASAQSSDCRDRRRPQAAAVRQGRARPGSTERIRFFDVKHIKAELTIDTKKHEVRGVVTHTLSPLHPYLTQVELDCGPKLKVTKVTVGDEAGRRATSPPRTASCRSRSTRPTGPATPSTLAIEYAGSPDRGLYFVVPEPRLSREAAVVLDPGRVRGHAPLAPLLRLSQRARHQRDDHHGREAPVRPVQRRPGRNQGQRRQHDDLPLEDERAARQLPDLAGRGGFRRLPRPGRRPAGRLLRGQARRRGDGAAVHGQDARR